VYLFGELRPDGKVEYLKIGNSFDTEKRKTQSTMNPSDIIEIGKIKCNSKQQAEKKEKELQGKYKKYQINKEWYQNVREIREEFK